MLTKRAFSVLEIVFVVLIISIIASIAIPKLLNNKLQTNIVKKGDIALIRKAIKEDFNTQVMKQLQVNIEKLDDVIDEKSKELFGGVDDRIYWLSSLFYNSSENKVVNG